MLTVCKSFSLFAWAKKIPFETPVILTKNMILWFVGVDFTWEIVAVKFSKRIGTVVLTHLLVAA